MSGKGPVAIAPGSDRNKRVCKLIFVGGYPSYVQMAASRVLGCKGVDLSLPLAETLVVICWWILIWVD